MRQGEASPSLPVSASPRLHDVLNYSGVEAAKWSPNRGYIDYPPLDSSKVATGGTRKTLLKTSRWLAINDGHAKGAVTGLANAIGFFIMQPATTDKAWNKLAEKHWRNRTKNPAVFDRTRKFNHARWQLALSRGDLRDGDILTALTFAESGAGQILVYNGHQIDSGDKKETGRFRDGVFFDQFHAHDGYNLVDSDGKKSTPIKASDALYYGDFSDSGEIRPMPRLTHAMNDLRDITEIDLDSKLGIKRRQFVGLYKTRTRAGNYGPQGNWAPTVTQLDGTQTNETSTTASTTQQRLVNVEAVTEKTGIGGLDDGEDYKMLSADNPGPNERNLKWDILGKIAIGLGLPPSVLFYLLGSGGPEVRFHMAILKRWIEIELLKLLPVVQSHYFWMMGTDMARGVLPFPDDDEWWQHIAIPCDDMTIDSGRVLSGQIAALKVGALTHADIFGGRGKHWEDQIELQGEIIKRASEIAAEKTLSNGLNTMWPDWGGAPAPDPAARPV